MPQLSLHEELNKLFSSEKSLEDISVCLKHPDFGTFISKYEINIELSDLALAMTHASFSHEYHIPHQELFEFFGDAVLQLIVTEELMRLFPQEHEGRLSKLRSSIVNEKSLATMARSLGLQDLLLVGKGEYKKKTHLIDAVLADSMEALVAKIYEKNGLKFTSEKFLNWLQQCLPNAFDLNQLDQFDAKSRLQEKALAKYKSLPKYQSEEAGKGFKVQLLINDKLCAEGIFNSKKNGERELAQQVLIKNEF